MKIQLERKLQFCVVSNLHIYHCKELRSAFNCDPERLSFLSSSEIYLTWYDGLRLREFIQLFTMAKAQIQPPGKEVKTKNSSAIVCMKTQRGTLTNVIHVRHVRSAAALL